MENKKEYSLVILKPDSYQKKHLGKILSIFESEGFTVEQTKIIQLSLSTADEFYSSNRDHESHKRNIKFMSSAPCMILILSGGENSVAIIRDLIGSTDPRKSKPGTIRYKFGSDLPQNSVHASDSKESAKREIEFFFGVNLFE